MVCPVDRAHDQALIEITTRGNQQHLLTRLGARVHTRAAGIPETAIESSLP